MPEGHTIHRYARLHRKALADRNLRVWSPQGRFDDGASDIDGRRLEDVEAAGKHLFYRWSGNRTLHVHLGLFGRFRLHNGEAPLPTDGTRLAMSDGSVTLYLSGPNNCELIDPAEEDSIRDRLGPDPLANGRSADRFIANLAGRRIPIGAALLDQKVVAGVGNVYRAEVLFKERIHPAIPAHSIGERDTERLWRRITDELRRGERSGRIITVEPDEIGVPSRRDLRRDERLYVYKRDGDPCRRCGTPIESTDLPARTIWFCPHCQAR